MKITVILCTYNRWQSLAKALESAAALKLPESDKWEILVVDNNSTDKTREVVDNFRQRYPGRFRYLFEPQQGKSHALNAGIREAHADVLAFMDDDVTVDPGWLKNLTASLDDDHWAGAGGRILPQHTLKPPSWLSLSERHALGPLALFDPDPNVEELSEPPFGTNMAFRRDVFDKHGSFRTDLGPRPGSEIRSEDSEFAYRLMMTGEHLRYERSAIVYHEVPENRLQKDYFLNWWFDKARADIRAFGIPVTRNKWRLKGIPLILFRRLTVWTLRWLVAFDPARRFSCKVKVWLVAGQIQESYRQAAKAERTESAATPPRRPSR
jgi:glycosyltransferase involved in cell wall biosynthesis